MKKLLVVMLVLIAFCVFPFSISAKQKNEEFKFGMLLVGPYNDQGWSQAHYEGGKYVEKKLKNTKMIYIDNVNPAKKPGMVIPQLVGTMVEQGAKFIIANSDDMSDGILEAARLYPKINFIHISGDAVLTGKAPKNLSNIMGKMEYGAMMSGFVAAMTTKKGKIAYLGPLANNETRRLAVSAYLGAKYAWEKVRKQRIEDLYFKIDWIGFWFNIPGVTLDPAQVSQNFFNTGCDVVISGIDTNEALVVAKQEKLKGKEVWAISYDYKNACEIAPNVCLGVNYFNWGPAYVDYIKKFKTGNKSSKWLWLSPDWKDINNEDTSVVGFKKGNALTASVSKHLDTFIKDLGSKKVVLFKGPLNYKNGSVFLEKDKSATDNEIWYLKDILEGMSGK